MDEESYRNRLQGDPGDPLFAELADLLRAQKRYDEAFLVCFEGLTANPQCHRGRLVLARLFYEKLLWPFAVRELQELRAALPDNPHLSRLLDRLQPGGEGGDISEATVAEKDFELTDITILDE